MIYASIQSDIGLVLALIGGCFGTMLYLIGLAGYMTARHIKRDYDRKGKAKGLVKKAGSTALTAVLKRLFLGRWR